MNDNARTFDETGELPFGTTLLEASAGTGKTHTITTLAVRLIAEEAITIDALVMVTFTRAAAAELRGRVRARIHRAVVLLEQLVAGQIDIAGVAGADAVVAHVADRVGAHTALDRLRQARERFDEATIDTIHGFCQRVLQQLGAPLGVDAGSQLHEDVDDIMRAVVNDVLIRRLRYADESWIVCLETQLSSSGGLVDAITRAVRATAGRPDLRLRPDPEPAVATLWASTCEQFRRAWHQEGAVLLAWLEAAQHARRFGRKQTYTPRAIAALRDDIAAWCAAPTRPLGGELPGEALLGRITRPNIVELINDPHDVPNLSVMGCAQALVRLGSRVATAFVRDVVTDAVAELARRTRAAGVWTFDDLLLELANALDDPDRAATVTAAIRERFSVALIDEFQDTDPIQWKIFSTLFDGPDRRLVLIGDPKQAIYGFRGADIATYLEAVQHVDDQQTWTLQTNHRSDQRLLDGLEQLFGQAAFEPDGVFAVPGIRFRPVRAIEEHQVDGMVWPQSASPALEIRTVTRTDLGIAADQPVTLARLRPAVARHVAREIQSLLTSGACLSEGKPIRARDIAVLTMTRHQAAVVQDALADCGVPAVVGVDESVLDTPEAVAISRMMAAMLDPADDRLVRTAAAGPIIGMRASDLVASDDDRWDALVGDVNRWAALWRTRGIAAALRSAMADCATAARLLATRRGERALTNLVHLIEIVHGEEHAQARGPAALSDWLNQQRQQPQQRAEALELRLEDDADAVQIVTIHRSKGLQYPIVWCPQLWDERASRAADWPVEFHDDDGRRTLDLELDREHADSRAIGARAQQEAWNEQLRLAYVALTRARHRCVIHVAAAPRIAASPLGRLLMGSQPAGQDGRGRLTFEPDPSPLLDADLHAAIKRVCADQIGASPVDDAPAHAIQPGLPPSTTVLGVRQLDRPLDIAWQRTSFSRLIRDDDAADPRPTDEGPLEQGRDLDGGTATDADGSVPWDTDLEVGEPRPDAAALHVPVPMGALPRGAEIGTLVHAVLERLDFRAAADRATIVPVIRSAPGAAWLTPSQHDDLADGLAAAIRTPLGPQLDDRSLADIGLADRLDELEFDLPVAGGGRPSGVPLDLHRIADVLGAHADGDDVLVRTAQRLRSRPRQPAYGFLTGSIDLVARVGNRWMIADYKSNWIGTTGPDGETLSVVGDYAPADLADQMVSHDYALQAHLYIVALHRYLRWRIADYDYDTHVAGAAYLFLRGMTGVDQPKGVDGTPYGVWVSRPSLALVEAIDGVLRGRP